MLAVLAAAPFQAAALSLGFEDLVDEALQRNAPQPSGSPTYGDPHGNCFPSHTPKSSHP